MLMAFVRYCLLSDCESLIHECRFYSFVIHMSHPRFPLNGIKEYLNWLGNIKVVDLSFLCLQERVPTPSWGRRGPLQWLQAKPTSTLARMIRWWVCLLIVCHCGGQGVGSQCAGLCIQWSVWVSVIGCWAAVGEGLGGWIRNKTAGILKQDPNT